MDGPLPNPYDINWEPGVAMATHITLLHEAMMMHAQDPLSGFHDVWNRTRRLLWSLPLAPPWQEFRLRYDHFMQTGEPGEDEERFYALGPWTVVTRELLLREELMLREITYLNLPCLFPALPRHPPIVPPPPSPPQGPPPSPPQFPDPSPPASPPQVSSGITEDSSQGSRDSSEVQVIEGDQEPPEIIEISSDEEENLGDQGNVGQGQVSEAEEEELVDDDPEEDPEESDSEEEESSSDPDYDPAQGR